MGSARTSRLIGELHRAFDGDAWHGPSVMILLADVTPAQAEHRPSAAVHSIAEITAHMTSWVIEVTRRLSGHPAADPADGDWPVPSSSNETGWAAMRLAMTAAMARLTEAVAGFPESRLDEVVGDERDRSLGSGVTYGQTVHGLVQHLAYHGGQIALLKKLTR
ncbi:MAG: DinB family protein [Luteitalea sp.]|jgi:uncharacterized damage-inducible protein DinB|nr:DinB family protein [Acidobacteriota bacterium]